MKKVWIFLVTFLVNHVAFSQWSTDPTTNNAICVITGNQTRNKLISDGSGGTIIAWLNQPDFTIYAQRINSNGIIQWTSNGIQVNSLNTSNSNIELKMVSDGSGGAIIIFQAFHLLISGDSYLIAQRINSNGVQQWGTNGVLVNELEGTSEVEIAKDGSGGAFVSWIDGNISNYDVSVQRINAAGIVQWGLGGVQVTYDLFNQQYLRLAADESGGAVFVWRDDRSGTYQLYAQRVNASGVIQWLNNGVTVTTSGMQTLYPQIINVAGGAIICWQRNNPFDIYAQKISLSGVAQWTSNGVAICTAADAQRFSQLVSDGSGGAIITWEDERIGGFQGPPDIYAQRVNSTGTIQWPVNGVAVSQTVYFKCTAQIAEDGNGGATIVWADTRPPGGGNSFNIFAQRINNVGSVLWANNGIAVSTAAETQDFPFIINDGNGGSIITWRDGRIPANDGDIYAQRVNPNGTLGGGVLPVALLNFTAKKLHDKIQLHWQTASEQNSHYFNIEKSADGIQFTTIGNVAAAGNSQQLQNYSFPDNAPFNGNNYYRLKQVDIDGRFTYSNVVSISNHERDLLFTLSPNPANNFINITYPGKSKMLTIGVYDAQGKLLKRVQQKDPTGVILIKIEVKELEPGIYFIHLLDGETVYKGKFIKY